MLTNWNMEDVKLVIEVPGDEDYIVTTDDSKNSDRFISSASVNASENGSSNPFGICGSRSYNFSIADVDDLLSPTNSQSKYYGKIKTGSKVKVYLLDTETGEWLPDGTYYINSIQGGFSSGYCDEVSMSCKDRLDNIGSKANPKMPCLRNITVEDFVAYLMNPLAKGTDWNIDPSLGSKVLLYGITVGEKVRDTLNALAQFLQARISTDRNDVIWIKDATKIYGKSYTLPYDIVNNAKNIYDSSTDYSKITVTYNVDGFKVTDVLLNDNSYSFQTGSNMAINNIKFLTKALSIQHIKLIYDRHRYKSTATIAAYTGHQDGLDGLVVNVEGEPIESCTLYVEGASIDKSTREEVKVLYAEDQGLTINLDIKYIIKQSEAQSLVNSLSNLINKMNRQITIKTLASPHIDLGDEIVLEDDDFTQTYKGKYRVIKYQTVHGQEYSNVLTLIRS